MVSIATLAVIAPTSYLEECERESNVTDEKSLLHLAESFLDDKLDRREYTLELENALYVFYSCDECGYLWHEAVPHFNDSETEDETERFLKALSEPLVLEFVVEACPKSLRPKLYEYVMKHGTPDARAVLAIKAKDLSPEILKQLALDKETVVKDFLLDNPFLPEEFLFVLLNDEDEYIRGKAQMKLALRKKNQNKKEKGGEKI
jgi:hypothetical protein